jgi:DNA-binding MarR family transcriptional regulator
MSVTEAHALSELLDVGPVTQQQLAATLRLQKSTVSRLLDQLAAADLVERVRNPADGRSVLVKLTRNGATRARRLRRARRELFEGLLEEVDPDELVSMVRSLNRLAEAADARP